MSSAPRGSEGPRKCWPTIGALGSWQSQAAACVPPSPHSPILCQHPNLSRETLAQEVESSCVQEQFAQSAEPDVVLLLVSGHKQIWGALVPQVPANHFLWRPHAGMLTRPELLITQLGTFVCVFFVSLFFF